MNEKQKENEADKKIRKIIDIIKAWDMCLDGYMGEDAIKKIKEVLK